jgi:predicted ester cyclase
MSLLFDNRAGQVERDTGRVFCRHSRENRITNSECTQGKHLLRNRGKRISNASSSEAAKAVVRRNTEEVQGKGRFDVFDELFADNFIDHTPQPNTTPDKAGVRTLYRYIRAAFPDFHAEIHWQLADGDRVTTYKTYYGTHEGPFLGIAPTHRKIHFETVDVMRVHNGRITDHWGVGNLLSLMEQIGGWTQPTEGADDSTVSSLHVR